jgi:hypothetical protein
MTFVSISPIRRSISLTFLSIAVNLEDNSVPSESKSLTMHVKAVSMRRAVAKSIDRCKLIFMLFCSLF